MTTAIIRALHRYRHRRFLQAGQKRKLKPWTKEQRKLLGVGGTVWKAGKP